MKAPANLLGLRVHTVNFPAIRGYSETEPAIYLEDLAFVVRQSWPEKQSTRLMTR